jgi:hypothetical protein
MNTEQLPQEGRDYMFAESDSAESALVCLTSGEYSGVAYTYGCVHIKECDEAAVLKYDYRVIRSPDGFVETDEFRNAIGDVLVSIIENNDFNIKKPQNDAT